MKYIDKLKRAIKESSGSPAMELLAKAGENVKIEFIYSKDMPDDLGVSVKGDKGDLDGAALEYNGPGTYDFDDSGMRGEFTFDETKATAKGNVVSVSSGNLGYIDADDMPVSSVRIFCFSDEDREKPLNVESSSSDKASDSDDEKPGKSDSLAGKVFVITGTLSKPRAEIVEEIESHGGAVKSSMSKGVHYLITGEFGGQKTSSTKLARAEELGISTLTEDELNQMVS